MNLIYQMPQSDEGSCSTNSIRAMNHSTIRIHFLQTMNHVEKCQGILWSSAIRPIKVVDPVLWNSGKPNSDQFQYLCADLNFLKVFRERTLEDGCSYQSSL